MREIRSKSEIRLAEIESHQHLLQKQLEDVSQLNTEQDQRLKLLEIQERASSFLNQGQYQRTLDYVALGLDIDSDDLTLLQQKWQALIHLKRFDEVRLVLEKLITIDSQSESPALDLCEIYLLLRLKDEFVSHSAKYSSAIKARSHLDWYFQAIILNQDSREDDLRDHIRVLVGGLGTEKKVYLDWRFDEFLSTIDADKTTTIKVLLLKTVDVVRGQSDPSELSAALEEGDDDQKDSEEDDK